MSVLSEFEAPPGESGLIFKQHLEEGAQKDVPGAAGGRLEEAADKKRYPGAFSSDEPTPFEKAGRPGAIVSEDSLRNPRDPYYAIQHEKAVHRLMVYLSVRGDTLKEISEATGYTPVAISNILRQPSAMLLAAEEAKRLGGQEVAVVLRGKALAAVQRLASELDNVTTGSSQSRIAAANAILDRCFGKPNQPITHIEGGNLEELTDEEIAKRLKEIEVQKAN